MLLVALILQPLVLLAVLVVVLRSVQRFVGMVDELAQGSAATAVRLVESVERERDGRRDEIQGLLQRIQAPEQAVVTHAAQAFGVNVDGRPRTERESAEASDEAVKARLLLEQIAEMEAEENLALGIPQ